MVNRNVNSVIITYKFGKFILFHLGCMEFRRHVKTLSCGGLREAALCRGAECTAAPRS